MENPTKPCAGPKSGCGKLIALAFDFTVDWDRLSRQDHGN